MQRRSPEANSNITNRCGRREKFTFLFGPAMLLYASGFVPPRYCSFTSSTVSTAILTLDLVALLFGLGYGTLS